MLSEALIAVINPGTIFLNSNGTVAPYTFHDWANDNSRFRYTVHHTGGSTNKRVIISELRSLLEHCLEANVDIINHDLYEHHCPTIDSDGWCGYPVVVTAIQLLGIGTHGPGGVIIQNRKRIEELLG